MKWRICIAVSSWKLCRYLVNMGNYTVIGKQMCRIGGFDSSIVMAFIGMVGGTAAAQAWSWICVVVFIKYPKFWVWCIQWHWRLIWGTWGIFFLMQGVNVQWLPFRFEDSLTCGHKGCIFHTHLFFYSSNVLWSASAFSYKVLPA